MSNTSTRKKAFDNRRHGNTVPSDYRFLFLLLPLFFSAIPVDEKVILIFDFDFSAVVVACRAVTFAVNVLVSANE